ncbi:hypothetical protein [Modestobacter roseus]|uniref:hypothetical protein n=1 Tax=Modestobacter roseus TaxID=1181884 RepID=UPI0034E0173E
MIGPLRKDVLVTGFVLAIPVLVLGFRGDLTTDEVLIRVLWCLGAGWVAVGLVVWAATPARRPAPEPASAPAPAPAPAPEQPPAP